LSEYTCVDNNYYYQDEPAPLIVWEAIGACLANSENSSSVVTSCEDGFAYADEYYGSATCSSPSNFTDWMGSYCFINGGINVACTNGVGGSPTRRPTQGPTSAGSLSKAKFTVAQTLGGVSQDDMTVTTAKTAFVLAATETLALSGVSIVDVVIVDVATANAKIKTKTNHVRAHSSASTSSVIVNYEVTFQGSSDQIESDYDTLTVQLAYYVESGIFQTYLQTAASNQNPVPAALVTCSATQVPSVSGYTIISTDDDSPSSSSKGLSKGALAAVSLSAIFVAAVVIGLIVVRQRYKSNGYLTGQKTSTAAMEDPSKGDPTAPSAVELSAVSRGELDASHGSAISSSTTGETGQVRSPILAATGYQRYPAPAVAVVVTPDGGVPLHGMVSGGPPPAAVDVSVEDIHVNVPGSNPSSGQASI
jgi:hypothetical protein